jgi:hypothetical protein
VAGATNTKSYGSKKARPSSANSKDIFMFSTTDASSIIDFSRATIYKGIVDSPPSIENGRIPLCSPSPLKNSRKDGNCRSLSLDKVWGMSASEAII